MLTAIVHKANGFGDIDDAQLVIAETFPDCDTLEEGTHLHERNAARIHELFQRTLPGGTYDALLRLMLLGRASQLVVSHGSLEAR